MEPGYYLPKQILSRLRLPGQATRPRFGSPRGVAVAQFALEDLADVAARQLGQQAQAGQALGLAEAAAYGTASRPAMSDMGPVPVPTPHWTVPGQTGTQSHCKEATSMAYSSIMGADQAPTHPSGREAELLGPSDNSDSGSDTIGTSEAHEDSDSTGTGERGAVAGTDAREGADILPDKVVNLANGEGFPENDPDAQEFTDLDNDDVETLVDRDTSADGR
jgi:hypothetical protein